MIFIGTSGRSGSYGLAQALNLIPGVEAHHQYACVEVQKVGTLYYQGHISYYQAMSKLDEIYGAAYRYSKSEWWIDVSNKVSWVAGLLEDMCQVKNFVYLLRDGQKVCLSYYHKLPKVYNHENRWPLVTYLSGTSGKPPPEERFWWPYSRDCCDSRWEMLCWHWQENYKYFKRSISYHPSTVKLEDLLAGQFQTFLQALGLPVSEEAEQYLLSKPHNVIKPENYQITDEELAVFERVCGDLYRELGYTGSYEVEYLQPL